MVLYGISMNLHLMYVLVSEMNDLVIHVYQFIRLFIITRYVTSGDIPEINQDFVMNCIRVLGTRDTRGRKSTNTELQTLLEQFYTIEYQPLLNHMKTSLVNKSYLIPYLATQIHTVTSSRIWQPKFILQSPTTHRRDLFNILTVS
jgi:hypothetical protein